MALTERIRRIFSAILSPHFLGREQEALVEMAGASLDEAQDMIDEGIGGVQEQIDDLHSEYGAGLIGIEDQGGNFTSTNVEGALEELAERDILEEDADVTGNWSFHSPITFVDGPYGGSLGASLTDDRAYTLPDASGTIALLDDIPPQVNLIAGSNINIGGTYPNLTISSAGSGPGAGVASVNGQVGDVVLTYSDVGAAPASHTHTIAQVTGLQSALNGKADSSHTHAAADITSGIIARARLGTGTADEDTYLRGDGVWAVPAGGGGGGGGGTVTRVQVASSGAGLSFTGGPITSAGTITGTLSSNLQGWSSVAPSSKANTSHTHTIANVIGLQSALDGKTSTSDVSYIGSMSGGSYDDHFPSENGLHSGDHSAVGAPSDSPTGGQSSVLHLGNTWGRTQVVFPNVGTNRVFVRTGSNTAWAEVHTTANFDPTAQPASNITSGSFHANRIPSLPASKISSGTFATARIPDLSSSYVATSGNQTGLAGNKTWTGNHTFGGTVSASNLVETSRIISAGNGLSGGGSLAASRTISMGTPAAVTLSSTNSVGTSNHTHAFSPGGTTSQYIRGNGTLATFPSIPAGTVTSVSGGSGLSGSVTSSGSISLGTPGTITGSTTNAVQTNSHTHALTLVAGDIPNLPASQITSGTLQSDRIPNLPASRITSGAFNPARIPDLSSSYVATSGNQTGIAGNKTFTGNIIAANVSATSDVRLKEEVEESRGRQELLKALRHYRWKWKSSGNPGIGVLAQEVQKHAPEYVHEDDEGTLSVDKAGLALEMMFAMIDKLEDIDGSSV